MRSYMSLMLVLSLLLAGPALAVIETYEFDTPEQETLFKKMTEELRCLVCQNQNLADSNAELARDLREKTHDMIMDGKSEEQIVDYMVARYGDFVLYRPPVKSTTYFLWIGPVLFLVVAVVIAVRFARSRQSPDTDPEISAAQLEKARELLNKEKQTS